MKHFRGCCTFRLTASLREFVALFHSDRTLSLLQSPVQSSPSFRASALVLLLGVSVMLSPPGLSAQERQERSGERLLALDTLKVEVGSRVSSMLPAATRAVEVIDRERIDMIPARNVAELLRWATSVDFMPRSPAQADLSIRGAGFEQVLVLVDGVRVSDRQTGHFDLNVTVPLDRVERVEILRGPASALYGADAVGGVVNIVTRNSGPQWEGRMEGGSFGTGALAVGGGGGGVFKITSRTHFPRFTMEVRLPNDVKVSMLAWPSNPRRFSSSSLTFRISSPTTPEMP